LHRLPLWFILQKPLATGIDREQKATRRLREPIMSEPTASNDSLPLPSKGQERRVAVRYPCRQPIAGCEVEAEELEERWPAQIRDVSATGMGLVLPHRFPPGTMLVVEIETPRHELLGTATLYVVHATGLPDGHWLLGCTLKEPLSDKQLRDWSEAEFSPSPRRSRKKPHR
jgi:hypothetical protein